MLYIPWLCNQAKGKKGHMPISPDGPLECMLQAQVRCLQQAQLWVLLVKTGTTFSRISLPVRLVRLGPKENLSKDRGGSDAEEPGGLQLLLHPTALHPLSSYKETPGAGPRSGGCVEAPARPAPQAGWPRLLRGTPSVQDPPELPYGPAATFT